MRIKLSYNADAIKRQGINDSFLKLGGKIMTEEKKEWLVVVWNDGNSQFFIERLTATEEEIKSYLLSLIKEDKKLSQEICHECTNSVDEIGRYEEPITENFMAFHAYASFDTYHIEYEARPFDGIRDVTEMIEES